MVEGPVTFEALVNQTRMIKAILGKTPETADLLAYLCANQGGIDESAVLGRYSEIDKCDKLGIVPNEPKILDKIIAPITYAKGSYMIGNYLGTIALCGLVSEMLAMLLFEISEPTLGGVLMGNKAQKNLFGRTFEKLGQERRVEILLELKLIDDKGFQSFNEVKGIRNKYLHLYSQEHEDLPKDALKTFAMTIDLVVQVLELGTKDGHITLRQTLLSYLLKKGLAKK